MSEILRDFQDGNPTPQTWLRHPDTEEGGLLTNYLLLRIAAALEELVERQPKEEPATPLKAW